MKEDKIIYITLQNGFRHKFYLRSTCRLIADIEEHISSKKWLYFSTMANVDSIFKAMYTRINDNKISLNSLCKCTFCEKSPKLTNIYLGSNSYHSII